MLRWVCTLRLVKCGQGVPTASAEAAALPLEPRLKLREAGVADGSSLLACVAMQPSRSPLRLPAEAALRAHAEQLHARHPLHARRPTFRQLLAQAGI